MSATNDNGIKTDQMIDRHRDTTQRMNPEGNRMMATGVLKAFGLKAKQLKKAQDSWSNPAPAKAH